MGAVYRAVQLSMDRDVAVKTLLKRLLSDYKLVQRFYREARAASRLDHPNIIQTYDFGIDRQSKIPFIAMEFLDGQELAESLVAVEVLDLETIRLHAPLDEFASLADAKAIVADAALRHAGAGRVHDVAPAVRAARGWVQQLLDAEIARLPENPSESSLKTERALRHFAGVIMHHVVARGHTLASSGEGERWSAAVETVFSEAPNPGT